MIIATVSRAELAFGAQPLLDRVDFDLTTGERVALVGRNGTGKSSLLKVLAGMQSPDAGRVRVTPGERVSLLSQDVPANLEGPVGELVASALDSPGEVGSDHAGLHDHWDPDRLVSQTLSRLGLDAQARFETLSGGQKRRVLLAQALVGNPGLLLLDEPTNHLDLPSIEWLSQLLRGYRGAVMFTTHDRRFLGEVATRIIELDRGNLTSWPGDYANYLRRRDERLSAEERADAQFDKRLAEEEVWIRQGIKARRTRNEGRVRRLESMRQERAQRRKRVGNVKLQNQNSEASGRRVIEANNLNIAFGDTIIAKDFSTLIVRGDRVGLIGANGAGKTSLLRVLIGEAQPDSGEVILGTKLRIAYADQHRTPLNDAARVQESVLDGADHVEVNGQPRHIISYLQDFLFTAEQARGPVKALSGGERNRLLLARLFARPANLLVMDEPTNDLDVETLELLESLLSDFEGTLIVVSHDREFLDNVTTSVIAFEGPGEIVESVGGYSDWLRRQKPEKPSARKAEKSPSRPAPVKPRPTSKLSYNESRELAALPAMIEDLETRMQALQTELADPDLYRGGDSEAVTARQSALQSIEAELEAAFERWGVLESQGK